MGDKISVYIAGGKAYFCLICAVLAIPSAIFFATEENAFNALVFFALSYSFMVAPIAPAAAMLQEITPNRMRGMLSAFYLLIVSLIGLALGPLIVAFLNDTYFGGGVGIQKALLISIPVFNLLAATFYFVLIKPYCARCS